MIKTYRKATTIQAEQFDYEKWVHMRHDAYPMVFGDTAKDGGMMATNPVISTLEGDMRIHDGDWIATGVNGEHWAIADEIFKKTYAKLPVIPEDVARYVEEVRNGETDLGESTDGHVSVIEAALGAIEYDQASYIEADWIKQHGDDFARAWLDGYQVEADK